MPGSQLYKRREEALADDLAGKLETAEKAAEKAREEESQRIAADFHDGPLQSFISLQMRLEILRKLFERDTNAGMQDLKQLQALAQSQVRDLRTFLHSMRPVDVDGSNLVVTLRRTAESFQKESGHAGDVRKRRHSGGFAARKRPWRSCRCFARRCTTCRSTPARPAWRSRSNKSERGLEISVDDNGHGFNFAGTYTLEELELLRLGPASLKRRARGLNADLVLESRPGRGAGIKFRIPLQ